MDLVDVAAAPAPWTAGGVPHLAGRLTLRGLATLRAFAAEAAPGAAWGSPEVTRALLGGPGLALLVWAALHRTEGVRLAEARSIAAAAGEAEVAALVRILFRRRPGTEAEADAEGEADAGGAEGREVDWGRLVDRLSEDRGISYDQVLDFTIDQLVNAGHRGDPPEPGERPLTHAEVVELTRRVRERAQAAGTYREPPSPAERAAVIDRINKQRDEARRKAKGGDGDG